LRGPGAACAEAVGSATIARMSEAPSPWLDLLPDPAPWQERVAAAFLDRGVRELRVSVPFRSGLAAHDATVEFARQFLNTETAEATR
jgi:hypothetical protein